MQTWASILRVVKWKIGLISKVPLAMRKQLCKALHKAFYAKRMLM